MNGRNSRHLTRVLPPATRTPHPKSRTLNKDSLSKCERDVSGHMARAASLATRPPVGRANRTGRPPATVPRVRKCFPTWFQVPSTRTSICPCPALPSALFRLSVPLLSIHQLANHVRHPNPSTKLCAFRLKNSRFSNTKFCWLFFGAPSSATSTTLPAGSLRCAPGLRPRPGRVGSCPMRWFKRRRKRVDSTTGTGRVLTDRSSCAERGTLPAPRFYPSIIRHRPTGGWLVRRPSNARKGAREQI